MAGFCANCGAALPSDNQTCVACGVPAATGAATAAAYQPVAPAVAPTQPYIAQPTAAPVKSGGGALKIILIVIVIVAGLGVLGMAAIGYTAWRVSRAFHVNNKNGQVTLNTPGGSYSANPSETYTASDLGTDIYPGAQSIRGGMKMDLPTGSMVTAVYSTSDSKDTVLAFYKSRFGSAASVFDTADGAIVSMGKGQQESVMVTISAKPSENDGKTKIVIVHTKSYKAS